MDVKGPVICGVDDSSFAAGAIQVARQLAQRYELPLLYAHVLHREQDGDRAEQLVHEVAAPEHAEVAIESGHPADRLVALTHERHASFLVLGNRGPRSSLLGSISADVSRRASCPVVVVPPTAEIAELQAAASEPEVEVEVGLVRFGPDHGVRSVA